MSFFFLFWSSCKFSTSWTIMFFFSPWQKRQGKKITPPPPHPHLRESKIVLDSGFHAVDSGFQALYSRFLVSGTWIPIVSGIPDFYAQDPWFSTPSYSSISGFRIPQAKFLGFRNLDSQPYIEHGIQSYDLYVIQVQRLNWSRLRF